MDRCDDTAAPALRSVRSIVPALHTLEGGGFPVRRAFPTDDLAMVDPFLLLDHFGPITWGPGEAVGAPDHPHRGFETVSYLLAGRLQHRDSHGGVGELGPGDVQWMTAGSGVVHSEMPHPDFLREGGLSHGFQLWVNLPRAHKMMAPRYQDIPAQRIPRTATDDGLVEVRVVAGESMGAAAVIDTVTPILFHHYTVRPGGSFAAPVPVGFSAVAYVFEGQAAFEQGGPLLGEGQAATFGPGHSVSLRVPASAPAQAELLLLGGVPLKEPVARYGPFVMNARDELAQAFRDYQSGTMGSIRPSGLD